ncbi:hypothetical protein ACO0QE_004791 [Hanseniaspora vineae]
MDNSAGAEKGASDSNNIFEHNDTALMLDGDSKTKEYSVVDPTLPSGLEMESSSTKKQSKAPTTAKQSRKRKNLEQTSSQNISHRGFVATMTGHKVPLVEYSPEHHPIWNSMDDPSNSQNNEKIKNETTASKANKKAKDHDNSTKANKKTTTKKVNKGNTKNKETKGPTMACVRCRRRHISCVKDTSKITNSKNLTSALLDPLQPPTCYNCARAGVACEYVLPDKKLNISMSYLQKLHDDIANLKKENMQLKSGISDAVQDTVTTSETPVNSNSKNAVNSIIYTPPPSPIKNTSGSDFSNTDPSNAKLSMQQANSKKQKLNTSSSDSSSDSEDHNDHLDDSEEKVPNFADRRGRLVGSRTGQKYFVGSSSMTLFGMEIQSLVEKCKKKLQKKTYKTQHMSSSDTTNYVESLEYPDNTEMWKNTLLQDMEPGIDKVLEKEGNAYRIVLAESKSNSGVLSVNFTLPSFSYAMLLVDTFITYNDGCFYFFNEGIMKENLRKTYNGFNVYENDQTLQTIWFCKCLLVFSIGEMYLGTVHDNDGLKLASNSLKTTSILPGSGFFEQASEIFGCLFSSSRIDNLTKDGAIEVLLLYAFYLQVADCTVASYFYFGQTLRACLILGWHVDAEKDVLTRFELEHKRRLWWTVYMFERMLSSKAGLPLSFMDNTISSELPSDFDMSNPPPGCEHYIFPESEYITSCIKITQVNAQILNKLYDRQPDSNILPLLQKFVLQLLEWRTQLPSFLQVDFNKTPFAISRLCTNVFTEYFQGLNLAIRPLLYHFTALLLRNRSAASSKTTSLPSYINLQKYSKTISILLNCSLQASINTIKSLWVMFEHNNLALFGYMDREYLFNSSCTLILFSATFGLHEQINPYINQSLRVFTKMRNLGNKPAGLRRAQLLKLMNDLDIHGVMQDLINKHYDNLQADKNFDKSYGPELKIVSVPRTSEKNDFQKTSILDNNTLPLAQEFLPSNHLLGLSTNMSSLRSTAGSTRSNKSSIPNDSPDSFSTKTELSENIMEKNVDRLLSNRIENTNEVEKFFQEIDDWSVQDNQLWKDISDQAMWLGIN